jgi:hypothetical protein
MFSLRRHENCLAFVFPDVTWPSLAVQFRGVCKEPFAWLVTIARADDVVIKKDQPSTTVIKKKEEPRLLPVPHEEHKTIIKKEHED